MGEEVGCGRKLEGKVRDERKNRESIAYRKGIERYD
jgi:hypothetical protein